MLGLEKRLLDGMCFRIGASRVRWMDGLSPSIYPAWCLEEKGGECRAWKCLACAPRVKKLRNGRVRALDWGEGREKDSSERILSHVPTARTLPSSASLASSASHCTSRNSFPLVIYSIHGTLAIYTKSLTLAYYSLGFQTEIHGVGSGPLRRCIPGKEERRRKTRTPGRLDKANEAGLNPVRSGRSRTNASPSSSPFLSQTSRSSSHTSSSPSTRLRVCATRTRTSTTRTRASPPRPTRPLLHARRIHHSRIQHAHLVSSSPCWFICAVPPDRVWRKGHPRFPRAESPV